MNDGITREKLIVYLLINLKAVLSAMIDSRGISVDLDEVNRKILQILLDRNSSLRITISHSLQHHYLQVDSINIDQSFSSTIENALWKIVSNFAPSFI